MERNHEFDVVLGMNASATRNSTAVYQYRMCLSIEIVDCAETNHRTSEIDMPTSIRYHNSQIIHPEAGKEIELVILSP